MGSLKTSKTMISLYQRFGYHQKFEWDKIALEYMKDCDKILDVGCGVGRFIGHDPKRIIGIDHNPDSLKICKQEGFNVEYAKVTKLSFKDSSFDGVHCSHVIEHLLPKEAHQVLKEMDRVLKRGGLLCLRTPLLYSRFYFDFTHIKPYYPEAILHYLNTTNQNQITLSGIPGVYEIIELKYRRDQLFSGIYNTPLWFLYGIFNILNKWGVTSFKKTGYMLILKKIK